jgi:hypothetical protein
MQRRCKVPIWGGGEMISFSNVIGFGVVVET